MQHRSRSWSGTFAASRGLPPVKWETSSEGISLVWRSWWSTSTDLAAECSLTTSVRTFSRGQDRHEDRCETPCVRAAVSDCACVSGREEEGYGADSSGHGETRFGDSRVHGYEQGH